MSSVASRSGERRADQQRPAPQAAAQRARPLAEPFERGDEQRRRERRHRQREQLAAEQDPGGDRGQAARHDTPRIAAGRIARRRRRPAAARQPRHRRRDYDADDEHGQRIAQLFDAEDDRQHGGRHRRGEPAVERLQDEQGDRRAEDRRQHHRELEARRAGHQAARTAAAGPRRASASATSPGVRATDAHRDRGALGEDDRVGTERVRQGQHRDHDDQRKRPRRRRAMGRRMQPYGRRPPHGRDPISYRVAGGTRGHRSSPCLPVQTRGDTRWATMDARP